MHKKKIMKRKEVRVSHTVEGKIKEKGLPTNARVEILLNMHALLGAVIEFPFEQPRIALSSERWTKAREETDARSTIYSGDVLNLLRE